MREKKISGKRNSHHSVMIITTDEQYSRATDSYRNHLYNSFIKQVNTHRNNGIEPIPKQKTTKTMATNLFFFDSWKMH